MTVTRHTRNVSIAYFVCWIPRQMIILINVVNPSLHHNHTQIGFQNDSLTHNQWLIFKPHRSSWILQQNWQFYVHFQMWQWCLLFIGKQFSCNQLLQSVFIVRFSIIFFSLSHKAKKKPKKSFSISSAFRQSSTNLLGYRTKAETNHTINSTVSESIPLAGGLLPG